MKGAATFPVNSTMDFVLICTCVNLSVETRFLEWTLQTAISSSRKSEKNVYSRIRQSIATRKAGHNFNCNNRWRREHLLSVMLTQVTGQHLLRPWRRILTISVSKSKRDLCHAVAVAQSWPRDVSCCWIFCLTTRGHTRSFEKNN